MIYNICYVYIYMYLYTFMYVDFIYKTDEDTYWNKYRINNN